MSERVEISNAFVAKEGVSDGHPCLRVAVSYPQQSPTGNAFIEVDQYSVRASDSIRISYDYSRDGYKIEQASKFIWPEGEEPNSDWQEVAFIQTWARDDTI